MNLDEQIFKRVDKQMLKELVNENVILLYQLKKFKRAEFSALFFYLI